MHETEEGVVEVTLAEAVAMLVQGHNRLMQAWPPQVQFSASLSLAMQCITQMRLAQLDPEPGDATAEHFLSTAPKVVDLVFDFWRALQVATTEAEVRAAVQLYADGTPENILRQQGKATPQ